MPGPKSSASYSTHRDLLDQAMESERGLKVTFERKGDAVRFRYGLYHARDQQRRLNIATSGVPTTPWDALVFSVYKTESTWTVFVRKPHGDDFKVELL